MGFTSQLFHSKTSATKTMRPNRPNQQTTSGGLFTNDTINRLANMYHHNPATPAPSDGNPTS
jgi:hypothetical protein